MSRKKVVLKCYACETELKTYRQKNDGMRCPICKGGPFIPIGIGRENNEKRTST